MELTDLEPETVYIIDIEVKIISFYFKLDIVEMKTLKGKKIGKCALCIELATLTAF